MLVSLARSVWLQQANAESANFLSHLLVPRAPLFSEGFDGGDCCSCTCESPQNSNSNDDDYTCNANGSGFACIDPSAECVGEDGVTPEMVENCDYLRGVGKAGTLPTRLKVLLVLNVLSPPLSVLLQCRRHC